MNGAGLGDKLCMLCVVEISEHTWEPPGPTQPCQHTQLPTTVSYTGSKGKRHSYIDI